METAYRIASAFAVVLIAWSLAQVETAAAVAFAYASGGLVADVRRHLFSQQESRR